MLNVPTKAKQGRKDKKCILLNLFSVFFQILNWNLYFPIISINFFHPFYFRDQQSFLQSTVRILWKWKKSACWKEYKFFWSVNADERGYTSDIAPIQECSFSRLSSLWQCCTLLVALQKWGLPANDHRTEQNEKEFNIHHSFQ